MEDAGVWVDAHELDPTTFPFSTLKRSPLREPGDRAGIFVGPPTRITHISYWSRAEGGEMLGHFTLPEALTVGPSTIFVTPPKDDPILNILTDHPDPGRPT